MYMYNDEFFNIAWNFPFFIKIYRAILVPRKLFEFCEIWWKVDLQIILNDLSNLNISSFGEISLFDVLQLGWIIAVFHTRR